MSSQQTLRTQIRALRRELAPPAAPTTPADAATPPRTPVDESQQPVAPEVEPEPVVPASDPVPDVPAGQPVQRAPMEEAPAEPEGAGDAGGAENGGASGAAGAPPADPAAKLAELEQKLNEQYAEARGATTAYLKKVGRGTLWGSLVAIVILGIWLWNARGPLPKTDCAGARCDQFHQAVWAAAATWLAVALVSWVKQAEGGVIVMLIGRNGRFSTSYFQAWVWTLVICWGFGFFLADAVVRKATDLGVVGNQLDADYFLLLGGPFAALVVAQQIKNAKLSSGDVQQVSSPSTTIKDLFSSDDGRTDLVDTQYLFFNFVALAAFVVMFARNPTDFPDLPDGLVLLTSGAALAYIGNKAVERNKPGITSVGLESGAGTPRVGDLVRIRGFNFVPAGAEPEEYLARVRVRFGTAEAPVTPPATPPATGVDNGGTPVGGASAEGGRPEPTLYADNVTSSALRVAIPPIPGLPDDGRPVEVVVVTSGGAETASYPLFVQPRRLHVVLPASASAGRALQVELPEVPAGEFVRVSVGGRVQDARVSADHRVSVQVPPGQTGSTSVVVTGFGGSATSELVLD